MVKIEIEASSKIQNRFEVQFDYLLGNVPIYDYCFCTFLYFIQVLGPIFFEYAEIDISFVIFIFYLPLNLVFYVRLYQSLVCFFPLVLVNNSCKK